jgi:hypothetical protein
LTFTVSKNCWEEIVYDDDLDEEERERLTELIESEGDVYDVLENQEGWSQSETQAWIWGPIQIENDAGEVVRTICADADGNVVDYVEE